MDHTPLLAQIRSLLEQPTAPFHEDAVRAEIERQLEGCPGLALQHDAFGNLIACYQCGSAAARFAFAAHMDHPAYVGEEFLGGVPQAYLDKQPPTRCYGPFSMWDLPAFEERDGRIHARACDDLIGCAAIVATLRELSQSGAEAACFGLFSRAEEVGFVGAIHLARSAVLPREVTVISLETSSERGGPVKMGDGVIVRVGDRTSIFDSEVTAQFVQLAQEHGIPHQRALMSGGTCEATAYQLYGHRAAGLCVALGNYHNCGPDEQIAPEFVATEDVAALVRLCTVAASAPELPEPAAALRARLEERLEAAKRFCPPMD